MPLLPTITVTSTRCRTSVSRSPSEKPTAPSPSRSTSWRPGTATRRAERVAGTGAETAVRARDRGTNPERTCRCTSRVRHEVATVADDDRVAIEQRAQLAVDARRHDRRRVAIRAAVRFGVAAALLFGAQLVDPALVLGAAGRADAGLGERTERRRAGRRRWPSAGAACVPISPGASARCTTRASPKSPNAETEVERRADDHDEIGPAERARSGRARTRAVVGRQQTAPEAVGEHRDARRLGERAQLPRDRRPSTRRRRRRCTGRCGRRDQRGDRRDRVGIGLGARDRRARRTRESRRVAGPNASSGRSTNVGPRCGVRAARQRLGATAATIPAPGVAVAAVFVTDATIGTWSSSCSEPRPQRPCGARPPITSIGEPASRADGHRADTVGHPRAGGERRATRAAGDLGPALGRERGRLLVAGVDERDVGLHAPVVEHEEVAAREREHDLDAVRPQHLGREPSAVSVHWSTRRSSRSGRSPAQETGAGKPGEEALERVDPTRRVPRTAASARRRGSPRARAPGIVSAIARDPSRNGSSSSPTMTSVGHESSRSSGRSSGWCAISHRERAPHHDRRVAHLRSWNSR